MSDKNTAPKLKILIHKVKAPDIGYWAEVADMPGCITEGDTFQNCMRICVKPRKAGS